MSDFDDRLSRIGRIQERLDAFVGAVCDEEDVSAVEMAGVLLVHAVHFANESLEDFADQHEEGEDEDDEAAD